MDSHDRFDSAEEQIALEAVVKVNGYKTCLPVVTVDDVGAEADHGQCAESCTGEVDKLLNIASYLAIGLITCEIELVIYEIECNAVDLSCEDTYVLLSPSKIHLEVCEICELVLPFRLHTKVFRKDNANVILLIVKILGECACNVSKTACFDKGYSLACYKKNLFLFHWQNLLSLYIFCS